MAKGNQTDHAAEARQHRSMNGSAVTFPRGNPKHDTPASHKRAAHEHTKPKKNRLSVKIGGEAGFGINVTGLMLTRSLSRGGLSVMDYVEYPSLIRGGHNTYLIRTDAKPVYTILASLNVLIALNKASVFLHEHELVADGAILYDSDEVELKEGDLKRNDVTLYAVPLESLAVEHGGEKLMRNVVALGAFFAVTGYPLDILNGVIKDIFGDKGKHGVIDANIKAAAAGHTFIKKNFREPFGYPLEPIPTAPEQVALTGAEAIALGAIQAGCTFMAAYPMTPATPVMQYLAAKQHEVGMVVRHSEDEIAAINSAIGAAFAGVRAMTASAGGGFALMVEALGLAAITETPLVIVEAQRPGPATGLPTWTDQADLRFVLHSAQGEFPRVLLAPGDVEESFYLTHEAFNLAERYQLPVFVMTDKLLAESHFTAAPFDTSELEIDRGKMVSDAELAILERRFKRYEITDDGVSPRTIPGQDKGIYMANSDEHDGFGYSSEDAKMRVGQMDKRFRKIEKLRDEVPAAKLHGPKDAELTIVGWGSTKGAILEALKHLKHEGVKANFLQIVTVWPFPVNATTGILKKANQTLLVEGNMTAQLGGLIREQTGIELPNKFLKYDGRPIYPEEVVHKAKEVLGG